MTTLTDPITPPTTREGIHPTMTTPTCTETMSPDMARAALVKDRDDP